MTTVLLLLAAVGATIGISHSELAGKVKAWTGLDHLSFMSCPQCLGFWVGAAAGWWLYSSAAYAILVAFSTSVLSRLSASALYYLEK